MVAAKGVDGATMRTIAAEVDSSTGFITHYFADKQELMTEVLRFNNAHAARRLATAIAEKRGLPALEAAAETLLPLDADRRSEWQVWVACWTAASPADELGAELRSGWHYLEMILLRLLEQAVEDGSAKGGLDLPFEAKRVVTMLAGSGLLAGVESAAEVRRTAKRALTEQLASLNGGTGHTPHSTGRRRTAAGK